MRNRLNIALLDYVLSRAAVFAANAMSVSEYVERSVAKSKHPPEGYLVKRTPKCVDYVRGPAEELPHRERLMLGSRRAILFVVGSLPSRAVATMSLCGNTSPPLIKLINRL